MRRFENIFVYAKMSFKAIIAKPTFNTFSGILAHFFDWEKYLSKDNSGVKPIPWIAFNAINYLEKIIRPDMLVFEFGSGGSTQFWSGHVSKVISIEHEAEWYHKMMLDFKSKNLGNVEYYLIPAEKDSDYYRKNTANPYHYISDDKAFTGKNFESYVRKIDQFPDEFFDLVVVDGRARPSCIAHAVNKIKKGGYLLVDNSERNHYFPSLKQFTSNWKRHDFMGPVPYSYGFSQTSILKKM